MKPYYDIRYGQRRETGSGSVYQYNFCIIHLLNIFPQPGHVVVTFYNEQYLNFSHANVDLTDFHLVCALMLTSCSLEHNIIHHLDIKEEFWTLDQKDLSSIPVLQRENF